MSSEATLILLGVLVILAPFLGLPYSWLMWIMPVFGLAITALAVILRARTLKPLAREAETTYEEAQTGTA